MPGGEFFQINPDDVPHATVGGMNKDRIVIKVGAGWCIGLVVDQLLGPEVNGFRRELGLPPVKRIFDRWIHSPTLAIGMFPNWFAPPQPDWIPQIRLAGFPLYDEHDVTQLSPEVESFLGAGSPPIAFTPGSAMTFGHEFFRAAVEACERAQAIASPK